MISIQRAITEAQPPEAAQREGVESEVTVAEEVITDRGQGGA